MHRCQSTLWCSCRLLSLQHDTSEYPCHPLQGGLIAGLVAVERQDIFSALILSSAVVEIDPKAAGWFVVRWYSCYNYVH